MPSPLQLLSKTKALYKDLSAVLSSIEQALGFEKPDASELGDHIMELKELLIEESSDYMVRNTGFFVGVKYIV